MDWLCLRNEGDETTWQYVDIKIEDSLGSVSQTTQRFLPKHKAVTQIEF
jgi:hypothetical protein